MMILNVLLWYLSIGLIGWLAFPLAYGLLRFLPDRGLAFARPLGLLLCGYVYWLLVSLGVLQNDAGGVFFALLAVALLSAAVMWANRERGAWSELLSWLRAHRALVLTTELLFLLAFALWTVVRAANPEALGTEKPMELAFINAILRSPAFPPSDPWLSGYAISYYYFGYVLVAMLARLSLATGGVAFNLGLSSWFALTALAAYGLVYNLLAQRALLRTARQAAQQSLSDVLSGARRLALLAPLFILLVSNLEGALEMIHARGLFWEAAESGRGESDFWSWLNIEELKQPPTPPLQWEPERTTGIWWWRASRVLQDVDYSGGTREIIDEFPAFSYLLGDLHPHVLAMPFALLAVGLALNAYLRLRQAEEGSDGMRSFLSSIGWAELALVALAVGGLAFLNTWDFPIYLALFSAAVILARYLREGFHAALIGDFLMLSVGLALAGVLLYLPFYLGFASQASGLLPSLVFFTRGAHFWVMFGSLLLPVLAWLGWAWRRRVSARALLQIALFAIALFIVLWLLPGALGALVALLLILAWLGWTWWQRKAAEPLFYGVLFAAAVVLGLWVLSSLWGVVVLNRDPGLAGIYGAQPGASLVLESILRRIETPAAWLSLFFLLALVWGLFGQYREQRVQAHAAPEAASGEKPLPEQTEIPAAEAPEALPQWQPSTPANAVVMTVPGASPTTAASRSTPFVLLLVLLGCGLVLFPEFFYLRDQFGWRMNTIFKFYFQAWIVWASAAAYASAVLWQELKLSLPGLAYRVGWAVLVLLALVYPYYGVLARTSGFSPEVWTLDGSEYLARYNPQEMAAIEWLSEAPYGAVAEAVGGSYSGFARVSTHSGQPGVLGWPGHESQWRGGAEEMGTREADLAQLYRARQWDQARSILERYNIRYVFVGSMEQSAYRPNTALFDQYMTPVYSNPSVTIYEYSAARNPSEQAARP